MQVKTLSLALTLLLSASVLRAQEMATKFSPATEQHDTAGPSSAGSAAGTAGPAIPASVAQAFGAPYPSASSQALARRRGITVQVEAVPAMSTVRVSFSMPPQRNRVMLELLNSRTGQVVYRGGLRAPTGQVELPVADPAQPYEARLATDRDIIVARMTR